MAEEKEPEEEGTGEEEEKEKEDDSMTVVRDAIAAEDEAKARQVLRRLWRSFPRDDARPYVVFPNQGSVGRLVWPEDEEEEEEEAEPTEEEKAEARAKARKRARGGLATFEPPEEREQKETTNAWQVLAEHGFGVDEMKRVLRSRTAVEVRGIKSVILGLLEAERKRLGDEEVREGLLAAV